MFVIRPEEPGDAAAIHAVHGAAFPTNAEARIVDRIRSAGQARISLVADADGTVIGHILFSPVSVSGASGESQGLGLAPVAVVPPRQREGVGSALIRAGLAVCKQKGYGFVVVLGHVEYYPRFGFARASTLGLQNEYGADEAFMVLELQPGSLPPQGGLVKYVPELAP
jgi:putative acetyltransferase